MSIFDRSWWGFGSPQPENSLSGSTADAAAQQPDLFPLGQTRSFYRYGLKSQNDVKQALDRCSVIWSIISQKAFQFGKGKIEIWNPVTKKPLRGEYKLWDELLRKPNKKETQRMFFMKGYSYMQAYGFCIIEPKYAVGFENGPPAEMFVRPNDQLEWDQTPVFDSLPEYVWFCQNGQRRQLEVAKLIIIKDSASVETDPATNLPLPRISPLEMDVSNVIASLEARGEMMTDKGANGLISGASNKDAFGTVAAMDKEEQKRVQAAARAYGVMKSQHKLIITNSPLSFTPMTFPVQDLGLDEAALNGIKAICNRFAFPFTALAEGFEGKYNNSTNARRDFQDTTIDPESIDFFEQLSMGLNMYKDNAEIYMDYSAVASVQASKKEKGQGTQALAEANKTLWELGLKTRNQILTDMDFQPVKGKEDQFDKYIFEIETSSPNTNAADVSTQQQ